MALCGLKTRSMLRKRSGRPRSAIRRRAGEDRAAGGDVAGSRARSSRSASRPVRHRADDGRRTGSSADEEVERDFPRPLRLFQHGDAVVSGLRRGDGEGRPCRTNADGFDFAFAFGFLAKIDQPLLARLDRWWSVLLTSLIGGSPGMRRSCPPAESPRRSPNSSIRFSGSSSALQGSAADCIARIAPHDKCRVDAADAGVRRI